MTPIVTYSLLCVLAVIFGWFAYHLRRDPRASPLDLITTPDTGRLSAAKIGQLVGVVVSSWVIIASVNDGQLNESIFLIYLAYVGAMDGFGKWLRYKQSVPPAAEPAPKEEVKPEAKEGE